MGCERGGRVLNAQGEGEGEPPFPPLPKPGFGWVEKREGRAGGRVGAVGKGSVNTGEALGSTNYTFRKHRSTYTYMILAVDCGLQYSKNLELFLAINTRRLGMMSNSE